ncbi:HlyD family efflux transporter periplasmic adaptor subunit [Lactobacillus intestinalis]|uniref:Accessory protein n=1 Tax=Lactobacillus intestinalis DSM 6629 TaxID=1423761 RepID=A0ABR5PSM5_9LACO|nr:HlyD family efflux transporter periplasmic adaptor subunit [Lactobacillus intestinalis]KRM34302.1 accessory protein [Lactobacillus intestinalis DSM 6629]UTW40699.1 HlyD family efflux transporter periplasmic adaptor subunit [Lactobacillus intestinalis]
MDSKELESSKFYSYKFRNFSTMIIFPAFLFVIGILISSFFVMRENTVKSIGVIVPSSYHVLKDNHFVEGQHLGTGTHVTLANGEQTTLKNKGFIHIDRREVQLFPEITNHKNVMIETYIPGKQIAMIKKGQQGQFQILGDQGGSIFLKGKVIRVGEYPAYQKEASLFKVNVKIMATNSQLKILRYGMQGNCSIITGKLSYFNYLKSKILNTK